MDDHATIDSGAPQPTESTQQDAPQWQPLHPHDRRVVGVLVEKAKTVPESYPLTLNALRTGCNQKSNRAPQMQLDEDQVEEALDRLRSLGAVMEIHGDGRVPKYRHSMYEWLGVEKDELAVVAELLLRGPQTIGELRGRAARMHPIASLDELRPILDGLVAKGLALYLTPPGRGCTVTHNLYPSEELSRVQQKSGTAGTTHTPTATPSAPQRTTAPARSSEELESLRAEVADLRRDLAATTDRLTSDIDELRQRLGETLRS